MRVRFGTSSFLFLAVAGLGVLALLLGEDLVQSLLRLLHLLGLLLFLRLLLFSILHVVRFGDLVFIVTVGVHPTSLTLVGMAGFPRRPCWDCMGP